MNHGLSRKGYNRSISIGTIRLWCLCFLTFRLTSSFVPFYAPSSTITRLHSLKPQNPFQLRRDDGEEDRTDRESNRGHFSKGGKGRRNKPTPLENRRGARPLNKAERKAKELYEGSRLPTVQRVEVENRIQLDELKVGEKIRGRVITVKEFGMFVDVGSKKDGLVHIKDVSKEYFIQDLKSRFIPGQDVDVWVKFADGKKYKLGLQMFPLTEEQMQVSRSEGQENDAESQRTALEDCEPLTPCTGKVTRVSNYGVFVDINAEVEAFLPRRKMKIGKRRRSETPWELYPVGADVKGYIHTVDGGMKRISLTTYRPEDWDAMLPAPREIPTEGSIEALMMSSDTEELGGDTRAANLRALERTLALSLDDDDDDDDNFEDDDDISNSDEDEEYIINNPSGIDRSQVLIDDFGDSGPNRLSSLADTNTKNTKSGPDDEVSVDDLFEDLAVNKDYVTIRDLMRWDYLAELVQDDELDETNIEEIFKEAGGKNGKLFERDFPSFIDVLADSLGLEEEDGDLDLGAFEDNVPLDVAEGEDEILMSDLVDDFEGADDSDDILIDDTLDQESVEIDSISASLISFDDMNSEDNGSDDDMMTISSDDGTEDEEKAAVEALGIEGDFDTLKNIYEKKGSKTNDLMNYIFDGVAKEEGVVTLEKALKWDFVKILLDNSSISVDEVTTIFNECRKENYDSSITNGLDKIGFEALLEALSAFEISSVDADNINPDVEGLLKSNSEMSSTTPTITDPVEIDGINLMSEFNEYSRIEGVMMDDLAGGNSDFEAEQDDEKFIYEEEEVIELYESLLEGEDSIKIEQVMRWEPVIELIDAGVIDNTMLSAFFEEAGGSDEKGLNLEDFNTLIELLAPFIEGDDPGIDDDNGDLKEFQGLDELEANTRGYEDTSSPLSPSIPEDATSDVSKEVHDKSDHADDDDDDEILRNVFHSLANGKEKVSLNNLLNWDLVLDLMGENLLTEESLFEKMMEVGGDKKGVEISGFDKLVDVLVGLYADDEFSNTASSTSSSFDGAIDGVEGLEAGLDDRGTGGSFIMEEEFNDDDDDHAEDVYDVDTLQAFEEVAGGKDYVSFEDISNWSLIKEMCDSDLINNTEVRRLLENAGFVGELDGSEKIDVNLFEAFLLEVSEMTGEYEEDEAGGVLN